MTAVSRLYTWKDVLVSYNIVTPVPPSALEVTAPFTLAASMYDGKRVFWSRTAPIRRISLSRLIYILRCNMSLLSCYWQLRCIQLTIHWMPVCLFQLAGPHLSIYEEYWSIVSYTLVRFRYMSDDTVLSDGCNCNVVPFDRQIPRGQGLLVPRMQSRF